MASFAMCQFAFVWLFEKQWRFGIAFRVGVEFALPLVGL
jgi:hypothetical protein